MAGKHRCKVSEQRQHLGWGVAFLGLMVLACCVGFVSCLGIKLT